MGVSFFRSNGAFCFGVMMTHSYRCGLLPCAAPQLIFEVPITGDKSDGQFAGDGTFYLESAFSGEKATPLKTELAVPGRA